MTDGNLDALNRHLAEREEYDRHQELLDAEKERDELAERVEELETKLAASTYTYIGKDGKPVLARDLEDQRDEVMNQLDSARHSVDVLQARAKRYVDERNEVLNKNAWQAQLIASFEAQAKAAQFLVDRIDNWAGENLTDETFPDWDGHVSSALERLRAQIKGGV